MDFSNFNVLVIGDVCLNIITSGESTRLSPEAPTPVILNPIKNYYAGMAGNVAMNLSGLGANVWLCTSYSDDSYGNVLEDILMEGGIETKPNNYSPTIVKERIMANNHQLARIDYEHEVVPNIFSLFKYKDEYFDFVIISDYDKGFINKDNWNSMLPELRRINKNNLFFVDTKKLNVLDFYKDMILFPNSLELKNILTYYKLDKMELKDTLNSSLLIETASEHGAFAYSSNSRFHHSKVYKEGIINTYGCGDVFIASFSLYYGWSRNIKRSLDFANYCSYLFGSKRDINPIEYFDAIKFLELDY